MAECRRMILQDDAPPPETVHVIDDNASMRGALDRLFRASGFTVQTYASVVDFLAVGRNDLSGCLVLDIRMPGQDGLDFQAALADYNIHLPVIVISGHGDISMSVRAMKAGAIDFLTKPFKQESLLAAVTQALGANRAFRGKAIEQQQLVKRLSTLSKRELQVIRLVVTGKMNKQVAGDLGLSEITVKVHRGSAMRKMGVRSLAELVVLATQPLAVKTIEGHLHANG